LFVVRGGSQGNTFCTSETFNKTTYSKMPFWWNNSETFTAKLIRRSLSLSEWQLQEEC
jgi:hypothetical protein